MKLINQFYSCIENDTNDYVHVKDALPSIKSLMQSVNLQN